MKMKRALIALAMIGLTGAGLAEALDPMPVATDELLTDTTLEDGDTVKRAQQILIDLGLLEDDADGLPGPRTAEALRGFQEAHGLAATGILDPATLVALEAALPVTNAEAQQRLIDLGYLSGTADGLWGSRSVAAMKLFQALHDLEVTGRADAETARRLFSDDAVKVPAGVYTGDKGEAVEALQRALQRLGFLTGKVDGSYGQGTAGAVKRFQTHLADQGLAEKYGIEPTGEATPATLLLLNDPEYSSYVRDLKPDEADPEVERVETRLGSLGYMDMPADDTLDAYALEALDLFRARAGLTGISTVTRQDIDALFSETALEAVHCAPHDIALGDTGMMVRSVEEALLQSGLSVKLPNGKYDSDVKTGIERLHSYLEKRGDNRLDLFTDASALSKEAVQALCDDPPAYVSTVGGGEEDQEAEATRVQRRLHTLFYLSRDGVDGVFGAASQEALKAFQADNGLPDTGVADKTTQTLLFSGDAAEKRLQYRVEVSLSRQRVEVYELQDDGEYAHLHSFICSTGLHNSTPRGIFLDGFPANRWHYFKKFNCWAQYSYDIEGDIMFHSVIYSSNHESSLRYSSVYNLGGPASHGCIRLEVSAARWLFEHCPKGSLVIIID